MNIGGHLVDLSPLSTLGALCLAALPPATDARKVFNQLLAWGLSMTVVGGGCVLGTVLFSCQLPVQRRAELDEEDPLYFELATGNRKLTPSVAKTRLPTFQKRRDALPEVSARVPR